MINVYASVPRPSSVMVWTPSHTYTFLAQAATHRLSALYRLIALRGLRRGEAVGLRWKYVDLAAGTAGVHWQITQLGWEPVQGKPKTEASDRTIALDEDTVTALRAHRKRQAAERLAAGEAWTNSEFVFTDEIGRPLHPQQVSDQFYQLAFLVGLPPVRLHDLPWRRLADARRGSRPEGRAGDPRSRLLHLHPRHLHQRLPGSGPRRRRIDRRPGQHRSRQRSNGPADHAADPHLTDHHLNRRTQAGLPILRRACLSRPQGLSHRQRSLSISKLRWNGPRRAPEKQRIFSPLVTSGLAPKTSPLAQGLTGYQPPLASGAAQAFWLDLRMVEGSEVTVAV
ncbi:tyrosine-type recombinase/integrase [Nonomuraea aurantiaca]|uniref:tyrosine-type recombinase/integrase n=1 Tax=Nonomuraea aurantiaca TaxID=2878562 RepID=UPI001CD97258|nr:tyrosine-type recombinase/integrase [Nonomuraea aurantiaca]MCA2227378.1 tyrosine-type recombinase/integrase [Nonomuraea aurantiaca]